MLFALTSWVAGQDADDAPPTQDPWGALHSVEITQRSGWARSGRGPWRLFVADDGTRSLRGDPDGAGWGDYEGFTDTDRDPAVAGVFELLAGEAEDPLEQLARVFRVVGFTELRERYPAAISDAGTLTIVATYAGGSKTVREGGHAGPTELWLVRRAFEHIVERVEWRRVDAQGDGEREANGGASGPAAEPPASLPDDASDTEEPDMWRWFAQQAVQRDHARRADPEWGLLLEVRLSWRCVGLCTGNAPHELVLRRDGRASYRGEPSHRPYARYVHDGSQAALPERRLSAVDERRLPFFGVAEYVTAASLRDLDDAYTTSTSDAVECHYTFVWERHTKRVREWAGAGPVELWVLKSLMWNLVDDLDWRPAD